ncbi:MAG TPA: SEC-C domain-containing protein [Peptostreptococcaceae bacterium]|nr:SEC-C domain-containing protein [Peptostreptococcaceae bacterium]
MIGRNELCSCGSGKKYKKCCLNKDMVVERVNRKIGLSQQDYVDLYSKLYEYSRESKFYNEYLKAKEMFYILDDEQLNKKFDKFFNTYYIQDHIMEDNRVITAAFYEENKHNLNKTEINILKNLFESYVSLYEISEIQDGKVLLNDLLLKNNVCVEDISLLQDLKLGDIVIARIVNVNGVSILLDTTVSISQTIRNVICNDVEYFYNQYVDVYKNMKTFLLYHTHILYKYIQQLLEPKVGECLKSKKSEVAITQEVGSQDVENECKINELLHINIEKEYLEVAMDTWKKFKNLNGNIKGSEVGWASAVEYFVKKEKGENTTQNQIAQKYNISSSTLGKRYKDLKSII